MARLVIGIVLIVTFIISIIGVVMEAPGLAVATATALVFLLFVPGILLVWLGQRRIALFRGVGAAALRQMRERGFIAVELLAQRTGYDEPEVRAVVDRLRKQGAIPPEVQIE